VADSDPGSGRPSHPDQPRGDQSVSGAGPVVERVIRARLNAAASPVPAPEPWLSTLADSGEQRLSRVAALGQAAQAAMRLGRASECLAVLTQQRAAAGNDQAALVWALTSSAACRAVFGQLALARADLAQVRQICQNAAPVLAAPFWRFTDVVCHWLGGNWPAALADATALDESQASPVMPTVAGTVIALRIDLMRGLGLAGDFRPLTDRLAASPTAEMNAWAQAGLDADAGRPADAIRRLTEACDTDPSSSQRVALPLVLHRMAEIAFCAGDQRVTSSAADALAELDQAAPVTEILTGLAQAYATGDRMPALRAQQQAVAEGAITLAAEALTVRGRIGDAPGQNLAAAHAAWVRIGAQGRAKAVAAAMRAAGLPEPVAERPRPGPVPAMPGVKGGGVVGGGPRPVDPGQLTERERSLARLVHEGCTNQQIARNLHISVKTVEAYLTRLYRKTSCSSRVDLAVAVTEGRIAVDE
jgi:DNA-binding NarL/FixJ family response regulator